jgi:hypothetical protein
MQTLQSDLIDGPCANNALSQQQISQQISHTSKGFTAEYLKPLKISASIAHCRATPLSIQTTEQYQ